MEWKYRGDIPIYTQLVELLQRAIASGELKAGERLSSVREMALEAGVNPNTMQRALAELETQGLVYSQRTAGRFVTEDVEVIRKAGKCLAGDKVKSFVSEMKDMGFTIDEIIALIREE